MDPRPLLPVLALLALVSALLTGWVVVRESGGEGPAASVSAVPAGRLGAPREALRQWDASRARAWVEGDVAALRSLYAPGSAAGRVDARMLSSYADRGLRVRGLRTQVIALEVLRSSPERVALQVTDRLAGGEVVTERGRVVRLPRDRPSVRVVVMRRVADEWLVVEVRDVSDARPASSRAPR